VLRGPENRGAVGEGTGEVCPPPQPTMGSGPLRERRKLPQRRKRILVHFELVKNESDDDKFDIFCHLYRAYLESNLQGYPLYFFLIRLGGLGPSAPPWLRQ